ncbi:MAG: hypothetical protein AB7E55_01205 [Pigmentiphaga sp.]
MAITLTNANGTELTLPVTSRITEITHPERIPVNIVPGRHGAIVDDVLRSQDVRRFTLEILYPADSNVLAETWRRQIAALFAYPPVKLVRDAAIGDYINLYKQDLVVVYVHRTNMSYIALTGTLYAYDPLFYAGSETEVSEDITGESALFEVENGGTVTVRPVITIRGSGDGMSGYLRGPTLTNVTTGDSISYNGNLTSDDVLEIDCQNYTAKLNGVNVFSSMSGLINKFQLVPGANILSLTCSLAGLVFHTVDAYLVAAEEPKSLQHGVDARLVPVAPSGGGVRSHEVDAVLQARYRGTLAHGVDAKIGIGRTLTHGVDAFLRTSDTPAVTVSFRAKWY